MIILNHHDRPVGSSEVLITADHHRCYQNNHHHHESFLNHCHDRLQSPWNHHRPVVSSEVRVPIKQLIAISNKETTPRSQEVALVLIIVFRHLHHHDQDAKEKLSSSSRRRPQSSFIE